jgi:hypothetical protein
VNKNPKNSGAAYLPERYKQQIEAKKRRRFLKKVAVICTVIVISVVMYLILSGVLMSSLNQSQQPLPESAEQSAEILPMPSSTASQTAQTGNVTAYLTPSTIIGTGISAQPLIGMLSLESAIASLRQDYPDPLYTLISVNLTDQYANSTFYEFWIRQSDSPPADPGFLLFIDARTGDPYVPEQETARISAVQVKSYVRDVFHLPGSDSIRIRYDTSTDTERTWLFTVQQENRTIITGSLDPDTGQIVSFSRSVLRQGRQADPLLDSSSAQKIADNYIIERNGAPLPVNMSDARYEPLGFPDESVAGQYVFVYNRIVQDIPCDYEGFTISVDSVTGEITEYNRRWNSPDNAFSVAVDPLVKRYQAILLVQQRAQETFPASASGFRIISAEIRWKDMHPPGILPRPGSISISWKVQFDDDVIRSEQSPVPATAWVDAQTGKILEFSYQH